MARTLACLCQALSRSGASTIPPCHWFLLPSLRILVQEALATLKLLSSPSRLPGVIQCSAVSLLPSLHSPFFQPPRMLTGAESPHSGPPEHRFALMDTQGTPMEGVGIPNRTRLLHIHLPAVAGVYMSSVTSHLAVGRRQRCLTRYYADPR